MSNVIEICNPDKVWSLQQARDVLPLLKKLSHKCDAEVEDLLRKQRVFLKSGASQEKIQDIDKQVQQKLIKWGTKLTKLGIKVYGGHLLFNTGFGYFSWYTNEADITHYLYYTDSSGVRRQISDQEGT